MGKSWLLCVLLGTLAWGQAAPSAPPAQSPAAPVDRSASVPADAAVITVDGVCLAQPKTAEANGAAAKSATKSAAAKPASADCKTVITKAQFEKLAAAVSPNVNPQLKKQLASVLPRLIALSTEARKQGLDKSEQFKETVKFAQMQILTNELQQKVQKQAAEISDADVAAYYKEHPEVFEQYNVDRLFVPRTKQSANEAQEEDEKDQKLTEEQQKAKEAADKAKADEAEQAMTKLAEDLRARAAKGEDLSKLQKEAFEAAGMKVDSPTVNLPAVRRTGLPLTHAAVFDLKPGEVSPVVTDTGGHYIYKLNSKTVLPLEQAKNEIHSTLQNARTRENMEKLNNSFKVETNEAYFGPGGAGAIPPPRIARPRPGMPPTGPASQQTAPPSPQEPATTGAQPTAAKPN